MAIDFFEYRNYWRDRHCDMIGWTATELGYGWSETRNLQWGRFGNFCFCLHFGVNWYT